MNIQIKQVVMALVLFSVGIACGGYLFSQSQPRSFLAIGSCENRCYKDREIFGLLTSVAVLRAPYVVPGVVLESDTCLAIRNPQPKARVHYVFFPKHDTRNIMTLTPEDSPYVLGCFALARELVLKEKISAYRLYTNSPELQEIAYLHFHLIAQ